MKTYKVRIMDEAIYDMLEIRDYIRDILMEPHIADEHISAFLSAIDTLKDTANIYELLDKEIIGEENIKKINVKNYIIFYTIDENSYLVQIIGVFYGMSNWQTKIKNRITN